MRSGSGSGPRKSDASKQASKNLISGSFELQKLGAIENNPIDLLQLEERRDLVEECSIFHSIISREQEMEKATETQKFIWEGAIPLQIHLHDSDVTTTPPPSPALILAPRIGYLPLLVPQIRPFFSDALPPGADTVWFDYKGLPLKWYIPTGVLFDLLCGEPERPWNLTVHFRGYPGNILTPCEDEESVKWSFINSLKEAAYIVNGNCKNIMNMSQSDQVDLWRSVVNGNLEAFLRVSSKLKLGTAGDDFLLKPDSVPAKPGQNSAEADNSGSVKTGRIPVRLYVFNAPEDFKNMEDAPSLDSWDSLSYINRPVEFRGVDGKYLTLLDAVKTLLPEYFSPKSIANDDVPGSEELSSAEAIQEAGETSFEKIESCIFSDIAEIKLLRIQGIEPKPETPFAWVANNLKNPEHFLHICVYIRVPENPL
ncbi:autophagy protein 5 [Impatiens glandulifera]|uniref:autophagy protein 5 n=1 Tax=Impatiens glandulifera TaxID=253017 RepID=UPI001FB101C9|nr:autophagy protein 5 [Impatiens glandulifera]